MDKELIDRVWKYCLPKEFKEEVKKEWQTANNEERLPHDAFLRGCCSTMTLLFGEHNLTSDAEGEANLQERLWDMLTPELQTYCLNMGRTSHDGNVEDVLARLFGSKCLPDNVDSLDSNVDSLSQNSPENCDNGNLISVDDNKPAEPKKSRCEKCGAPNLSICAHMNCQEYISQPEQKLAEPKYHKGEKVCYNGYVYEIEGLVGKNRYALKGLNFDLDEDMIDPYKPYTEPKENMVESRNLSQETANCDKSSHNPQSDKAKAGTNHFVDSNEMVNDSEVSLTKVPPNPSLI